MAARWMAAKESFGKFVVASCDAPEILEPAETALDDIAPFVGRVC